MGSSSATVISTNTMALTAHRNLGVVGTAKGVASHRLSTGKKINSAADDAAGLAISEKMRAQIKGLDMASKNAQDGVSMIQTAEGSLAEIEKMTQRIRELVNQGANDSNTTNDRQKIANEIRQLTSEITDMAGRTQFNTKTLATGTYASGKASLHLQIGANSGQSIRFHIGTMTATGLGIDDINVASKVATKEGSQISGLLDVLDKAIEKVSVERANLGAVQNRLGYTINNLETSSENLSAAKMRIEDADMAKEMMEYTKNNVLQQAATSMLAQANQAPNQVLQLLQ